MHRSPKSLQVLTLVDVRRRRRRLYLSISSSIYVHICTSCSLLSFASSGRPFLGLFIPSARLKRAAELQQHQQQPAGSRATNRNIAIQPPWPYHFACIQQQTHIYIKDTSLLSLPSFRMRPVSFPFTSSSYKSISQQQQYIALSYLHAVYIFLMPTLYVDWEVVVLFLFLLSPYTPCAEWIGFDCQSNQRPFAYISTRSTL